MAESHGPKQLDSAKIAMRILALTSMFIFAIGWVFVHAVLEIYCSPDREELVRTLEAECDQVSTKFQDLSTKDAIDSLVCIDSAVRESMRLNDVMVHLLPLDVIGGDPIDLGNGLQINPNSGVRTVFPAQMVHLDRVNYANPESFDAFRFLRVQDDSTKPPKREHMTSVSTTFLPFGYGRHACPGRWFVAHMVKQGIAYLVTHYDIEVTEKPGKRTALLNFMLPPQNASIRVRTKVASGNTQVVNGS